jgi:phosphoglycerate dehydrogenase-like enzyme
MLNWITRLQRALGYSERHAQQSTSSITEYIAPLAIPALIRELGLKEDQRPVREYAQWRPPQVVTVMGASPERLRWLQPAAPNAKLISQLWNDPPTSDALVADCLIGWCTEAIADRARDLRWIHLSAAGVEEVLDLPGLRGRDLLITNLQRVAGPVIAEHAFALVMCLCRCLPEHLKHQHKREWLPNAVASSNLRSLYGKTILVAGLGGIGSHIARIAHGFGMRVVATRRSNRTAPEFVEQVSLPHELIGLAADADLIVNCLPLTRATRGLFDAGFFSSVKRGALFVNVARGGSVVTDDLTDALRSGQLGGAALDVTNPEPLPKSHPLWRMSNVVITPHIAGRGSDTDSREWLITRENLRRYVAGERMLSVVDRSSGY